MTHPLFQTWLLGHLGGEVVWAHRSKPTSTTSRNVNLFVITNVKTIQLLNLSRVLICIISLEFKVSKRNKHCLNLEFFKVVSKADIYTKFMVV